MVIVAESVEKPGNLGAILRTADAAGSVREAQLGASLTGYVITYCLMFLAYMVVLTHLAGKGARGHGMPGKRRGIGPAASPLDHVPAGG